MGVAPATAAPAPRESAGRFTPVFRGKEIFTNHSPSRTKRKSVIAGSGMRSITLHCVRDERICKICGACGKYTGSAAAKPPVGVALPPRGRGGGASPHKSGVSLHYIFSFSLIEGSRGTPF